MAAGKKGKERRAGREERLVAPELGKARWLAVWAQAPSTSFLTNWPETQWPPGAWLPGARTLPLPLPMALLLSHFPYGEKALLSDSVSASGFDTIL